MNKHNDVSGPTAADQAPGISAGTPQLASARRRRLIKLGASSVPVALTLTSRPVMAWHCNTTSAWGSAILQAGGASVKARYDKMPTAGNEGWYVSDWGTGSAGWKKAGMSAPFNKSEGQQPSKYARDHLLVSHLYGSSFTTVGQTVNVRAYLQGAAADDFGACMLTAMLNLKYSSGSSGTASCLSTNDTVASATTTLNDMAACTYTVNGKKWLKDDVVKYLRANYMA